MVVHLFEVYRIAPIRDSFLFVRLVIHIRFVLRGIYVNCVREREI